MVGDVLTITEVGCEAGSGIVTRGCVFFISTVRDGRAGGLGETEMRAVSFFGPCLDGGMLGADGGKTAAGRGMPGNELRPIPVAEEGGTGAARKRGGGATAFDGAGGKGAWAIGGRGGGVATLEGGRSAVPLSGAPAGKFMRTVSRAPVPGAGDGLARRGGKVMRTVSFFGSF
jgi:hypothetical protein